MKRFSYGTTPDDVIRAAVRAQCPDGYSMTLRARDWSAFAAACNQGIDSHLEAITERTSADASTGKVLVHPDELHVLLRRLWKDDEDTVSAELRSGILSTLDIEEV